MEAKRLEPAVPEILSAQELLAGSALLHEVEIPEAVRCPSLVRAVAGAAGRVRIRPLSVGTLALISRAARDDAGLVPLLMIKEALAEPAVTIDQARQMHVGLVHFLVGKINEASGLGPDGDALDHALRSPAAQVQVLLAKHFGWTPQQVAQLTPGQVMVYLAGIEKLLALQQANGSAG
jgi:hypothetical protein